MPSFSRKLGVRHAKIGNLIQIFVLGLLILSSKYGILVINPVALDGVTTWVAINAMAMSYALLKRPFTVPHVKDVKCPQCDTPMHAQNLRCPNCDSTFTLK